MLEDDTRLKATITSQRTILAFKVKGTQLRLKSARLIIINIYRDDQLNIIAFRYFINDNLS